MSERVAMEQTSAKWVSLREYRTNGYAPGRSVLVRILWYYVSLLIFESGWLPVYGLKRLVLRLFGASIGRGVISQRGVAVLPAASARVRRARSLGALAAISAGRTRVARDTSRQSASSAASGDPGSCATDA